MIFGLTIIFLFIILILHAGDKNAFIAFFALCIIGCTYSVYGPVTIEDILIIIFSFIAFCNNRIKEKRKGYPFAICTILYSTSVSVSAYLTQVTPHYGMAICECLRIIFLPFLLYIYITSKKDIKITVRLLAYIAISGFILSLLAEFFQENLYLDFIRKYTESEVGWNRIEEERYGFFRTQGFCLQPVSYGYICVTLFSAFLLLFYKHFKVLSFSTPMFSAMMVSCVVGCILSGSRSGIIPLALCLIYFYGTSKLSGRNIFIFTLLFLFIFYLYGTQWYDFWDSIYNSEESKGSNAQMRLNQLDISLYYFQKSPIWGLGTNAMFDLVHDTMGEAILGGESVWFKLLINQGVFGCIAYIFLYISSFLHIKRLQFDAAMFLTLQLIMHTITSTPGYDSSIFLCFVLLAKKVMNVCTCISTSTTNIITIK